MTPPEHSAQIPRAPAVEAEQKHGLKEIDLKLPIRLAGHMGSSLAKIAWFLLEKAHPLVLHCNVNMSI
jgi:hypothetical protein